MKKICCTCKVGKSSLAFDKKRDGVSLYAKCRICRGKPSFKKPRKRLLSKVYEVQEIIDMLSFHLNISVDDLKGKDTARIACIKRHLVMYSIFRYTNLTLKQTAKELGRSDHTTTMHAIDKIIGFRNTYKEFNRVLRSIQKALRSGNVKYFYKQSNQKEDSIFSF